MKQNKKLVLLAVCPACYSLFMGEVFCVKGEQERIAIGCKIRAAGKQKFFGAAVFQKCCRGVGEQPTFTEQIRFCNLFSLLQLHFLKLSHSKRLNHENQGCKFEQGNGAIAARWQAKAGVEPPFAGR